MNPRDATRSHQRTDVWVLRRLHRLACAPAPVRGALITTMAILTIGLNRVSGADASLLLGYSLTVALCAWIASRRHALGVAALLSTATAALALAADDPGTRPAVVILNAVVRFVPLALNATVVSALRVELDHSRRAAHHDHLTGARSRRGIIEDLQLAVEHGRRTGAPVSIVYFDLDGLKQVNDTEGHAAGDALIRSFTDRMLRCIRDTDQLGRLGGDEFLLVCPATDERAAWSLVERIVDAPGVPVVSWGTASTATCADVDELLEHADRSMYAAKVVAQRLDHLTGNVTRHPGPPARSTTV